MKLSRSTSLMIPLAGVLLVAAAGAVLATSGTPSTPAAIAPAAATPTPAPSAATGLKGGKVAIVSGVLDDLVAKGTITAAQKQAILDALSAKRDAVKAQRKADRAARQADRQQLRGFLADGVITRDEFDKLPADSPLRTAAGLMDDGKITVDELKGLGRELLGGGLGKGWRGLNGANPAPSASPSTGG